MGKTCLNRLIRTCETINKGGKCKKDYNPNHYPNNYHCPNYHEVTLLVRTVVEVERACFFYRIPKKDLKLGSNGNGNGHRRLEQEAYIKTEEQIKELELK